MSHQVMVLRIPIEKEPMIAMHPQAPLCPLFGE